MALERAEDPRIELAAKRDERTPLEARPLALRLIEKRSGDAGGYPHRAAGSLRRWRDDRRCGHLAISPQSQTVVSVSEAASGRRRGRQRRTKCSVILTTGLRVDLRVVEPKHWGAALQYFTGSKEHNVQVRELAQRQGWSLNEYGLTATGAGDAAEGEQRFFAEEAELYAFLGMACPPPELRENRGEVKAAREGVLPELVRLEDIGELHGHSTWSDGGEHRGDNERPAARLPSGTSPTTARAGHGRRAGQQAPARTVGQIAALNEQWRRRARSFATRYGGWILSDGALGLPDEALAERTWWWRASAAGCVRTARRSRALSEGDCQSHVDILGHATGRLIGSRPPSEIDMERILRVCAETGTVVEINAHPSRLDVNDVYARRAVELGCKIAINSDAHETSGMEMMEYGIAVARRAWLRAADVINTYPLDKMLAALKDRRGEAA